MGFFALKFFIRGIAGLASTALLLGVTFPSVIGFNPVGAVSNDPAVSKFVNAVVSNLPSLGKSVPSPLGSSSGGVDPSQYLDVQGTFKNITDKLKSAGVAP